MKSRATLATIITRLGVVCALQLAASNVMAVPPPRNVKTEKKKPAEAPKPTRHKIIYPPGFRGDYKLTPVMYALHGYGGNREQMISIWREPCAQLGVILIVGNGEGPLGDGAFKWGGPEDAGRLIAAARHELRKNVKLDPSAPRILSGFSQGGFATWSLALRYPTTYRRLIPCCGMYKSGTDQMIKPLTEVERLRMKRWRAYIMCGVLDKGNMVPNNNWIASQLADLGAAVCAPFRDPRDPSYALYQDIGHAFPGTDAASRNAELVRALRFVLRGDEQDEANWFKADAKWQHQIWAGKGEVTRREKSGPPESTSRPKETKEPPGNSESPANIPLPPAKIGEFQGEYRFLSNFWPAACEFEDLHYPSSEHAYQAAKSLDPEERKRIAALPTPSEAKKAGRELALRPDWETVKFDIMRTCVRSKFALNPDLAAKLLATGDALLEEGNTWGDKTWGVVDGVGENRLGKILMDVRSELRAAISQPSIHPSLHDPNAPVFREESIRRVIDAQFLELDNNEIVKLAGINIRERTIEGVDETTKAILPLVSSKSAKVRVARVRPDKNDVVVYYRQPLAYRDISPTIAAMLGKPLDEWSTINELVIQLGLATADPDAKELGAELAQRLLFADQIYSGAAYRGIVGSRPAELIARPTQLAYYRRDERFALRPNVIVGDQDKEGSAEFKNRINRDIELINRLRRIEGKPPLFSGQALK